FGVSTPSRGKTALAWSGGTWPALTAAQLPIDSGDDFLSVTVYFEPIAPGEFRSTLYVQSDDLFSPERAVVLTGRSHTAGPCAFRVDPESGIEFGNVPVGNGAVLGFRFENTGSTQCAVKDIHVDNDAGGVYFMPGGPIAGGFLGPTDAFSAQV